MAGILIWRCMISDFNPRSREGSDAFDRLTCDVTSYFNPRSREGSDLYAHNLAAPL